MSEKYGQGISEFHALRRTSPYGENFVGVCTQCGLTGLTLKDLNKRCENPRMISAAQSLAEAISPEKGN